MIGCNFKCVCGNVFEVYKNSIEDDFSNLNKCPICNSIETYRIWSMPLTSIAEGILGNSKNNYEKNLVYHPSNLTGKLKTKTIKKIK